MDCVFCKIIKRELPSEKIYEDEKVVSILDINPNNPGHALVMPKEHILNVLEAPENVLADLMVAIKKVGQAQLDSLQAKGFNVLVNNMAAAGQLIDHLHFHVIPRFPNDGLKHWPHKEYGEGEMKEVAGKLRDKLT